MTATLRETIERTWGAARLGRIVDQRTAASRPNIGRRELREFLDDMVDGFGVALHDRAVPGRRWHIDHLVVAPSGVWAIAAMRYSGRVVQQGHGHRARLMVCGKDRSSLASDLERPVHAVNVAMHRAGEGSRALHPVVCLVNSEWGMFARPFDVHGVVVTWPERLAQAIRAGGSMTRDDIDRLAARLSAEFPTRT